MELPIEDSFSIEVNLLTTAISRKWADNDNYVIFIESNDEYKLDG